MSPLTTSKNRSRNVLRSAWHQSPPSRFLDYKDFFATLYAKAQQEISRYTYQQFSQDLGFSSNNAAYIVVNGHRKLNEEQARQAIASLDMTGVERRFFLKLMEYTDTQDEAARLPIFQDLVAIKEKHITSDHDRNMLKFFSEWYHSAIFELVALENFQSDPAWIADRFYKKLTPDQIQKSLELLEHLNLITFDAEKGRHVKRNQSLSTGDEVRGLAVAGYHLQMLQLSQSALSQIPHEDREIAATTLAVSEDVAKRLKDDLRTFRRYAVFLSEQTPSPDRIVQLNLQLFPMTKV